MRQVVITRAGGPEVLQVRESADPEAGPGQVRVRVRAAGINFADLMARLGIYPDAPKIPCVVGYEISGVVDQVGSGVSDLVVGDRVFGVPYFGGYSDVIVLPTAQLFKMPERMSFEEAAALPVVYLTAHHMMIHTGQLHRGARVLIHSAAGGVGLAAIELARSFDCEIFGLASPSKHEFLRSYGVQHPLDSGGDWPSAVQKLLTATSAPGLDLVLDPVGGKSWGSGYDLLGPTGRMVCFGFSAASSGKQRNLLNIISQFLRIRRYSPMTLMNDNKSIAGVNMAHLFSRLDILRPQFAALLDLYNAGQIKPFVDRTFSFAEAPAAHHYLHDRKARGKILLIP